MAYTERYVTNSGAGSADGSSLANAWSWATMLTTAAAGDSCNIQGAITRTTSTDAFTNAGATANPMRIRGINATVGDLDPPTRSAGGALTTTNFAVVTYTTGKLTLPAFMVADPGLSFVSAIAGITVTAGAGDIFRGGKYANTHATSGSSNGLDTTAGSCSVTMCDFTTASSSANAQAAVANSSPFTDCLFTGPSGGGCVTAGSRCTFIRCDFRDAASGITSVGNFATVENCSFRNITNNYINNSTAGPVTVRDCIAWGNGGTSKFYNSTTSVRVMAQQNNAVGNMGAGDTNPGNWPVIGQITITADPFTSSTNLTLNSTAGGGAACKAAGTRGQDLGAWQTAASAGGISRARAI